MTPIEHAMGCLVDGGLQLSFAGRWEPRVPTHDETLRLVQECLCTMAWRKMGFEGILDRAQAFHGRGSYVIAEEPPWAPPFRVRPGGCAASVDAEMRC